jgi:alpha-2-macroglobulin
MSMFVRCLLVFLLGAFTQLEAADIKQFLAQGQVDQQTRATAVFSDDMVRLGDAQAAAPFKIDCGKVGGSGRWVDARTWSWQLPRPLKPGERCSFSVRNNLRTLAGEEITGRGSYQMVASGPWARSISPRAGNSIEEDQAFIVDAGSSLDRASVEKFAWCEADGVGNRIPVHFVSDAIRKEVLKRSYEYDEKSPVVVLTCAERLPSGAKAKLVWGKGVMSEGGGARNEKDESFAYTVREPFQATMSCERERASAPCSPLSSVTLEFGASVDLKQLQKIRLITPEGSRSPTDPNKGSSSRGDQDTSVVFPGPFPQNAELRLELPSGIKDDAGRALVNAGRFPLKFRTGTLPPLAKFPGGFGIVELKEGGVLPVTVRNIEPKVQLSSLALPGGHRFADQRLTEDGDVITAMAALSKFEEQTRSIRIRGEDGTFTDYEDPYYARELSFLAYRSGVLRQDLPKPGGSGEFEVMGIPLGKPGFHIVEIESRMLGAALLSTPKPMYVRTSVLVTNLAVHLKRGRDNGLVWVTAFDSGKPVAGADVRVSGCDGKEQWRGKTDSLGRARIDQPLPAMYCQGVGEFVFASARLGDDYSFVRSDWNEGIEPWRFGVETWGDSSDFTIHTVLDRSLLRPGETVSMKHLARLRDSRGFALPDVAGLPTKMTITQDELGTEFSFPITWNKNGSAVSQWKIPSAAKRGSYRITLSGGMHGDFESGQFQVADFRLPAFTGSIQGVPSRQVAPEKVPLTLGLSFLNGGAAKGVPVSVSATLRPRWPTYQHYDNFNFTVDFNDDTLEAFAIERSRQEEVLVLDKEEIKLDKAGSGKLAVALPNKPKGPSELYSEMTFTDPNGEVQTIHGSVELSPSALVIGVDIGDWASERSDRKHVQLLVLDTAGRPQPGQEVRLLGNRRVDYSHRRRIVGGFYAYENSHEYTDLGVVCKGRTDSRGMLACDVRSDEAGLINLLAEAKDSQGNIARASASFWVAGAGDLWFEASNQDRIDVIPEKRTYQPGETARLQVRTPFREATALVSVEAEGIIETFVQPLSRFNPVIELPVKAEWGPNVFISVLTVRGRVEPLKWYSFFQWGWREPVGWFKEWWNPQQPTAMVDLAKPAYRIGLAEIGVGTDGFKLDVEVTPEKTDYRPRDEATVRVQVRTPDGKPAANAEVAFAAVDQALLELRPNETWDVLDAFLQKRGYEVETATAQSLVIGKRHFGKKALPPGGGGGRAPARELFDTLLLWNPSVKLDANGMATIKVPMNDSLTEFKLVAVATEGAALFGTGSAAVRTKQDLQMISGLPPLVREKDSYQALLTLRNGTAKAMTVKVTAKAGDHTLEPREVRLDAEGAAEVSWTMKAPEDVTQLPWEFEASGEGGARDHLKIVQEVAPAVPVTVQQATFTRIEGRYEVPVVPPTGALPGKGGLEIGLAAKLSTPPPGLKRFFLEYPYGCLEQRTSIAVGLHDKERWQAMTSDLPALLDSDGLARYFPGDGPGNVTLTAYVLDMSSLSGFALPEAARTRMIGALNAFVEGRIKPHYWSPQEDLTVRKLLVLQALTRQGQTPTRTAAALDVEPMRLPTAALIDWYLVLKRLPELPQRDVHFAAAEQELRNRLAYTGGRLSFTTERSDYWWWMMVSGDSNAFRLIEAVLDQPGWQDDLPKLMRGAIERQAHGRWFTTTANAWAAVTLQRFGERFERDPVSGVTRASLGKVVAELKWQGEDAERAPLSLPWPPGNGEGKLAITHEGKGQPWASVQVLAAIPAGAPRAYGYRVVRQVTPMQEKITGKVSRGDVWRVTLDVDAEQDMSWVVLSDPIPAGARILGDGDGRDSQIATMGEDDAKRGLWPTFIERTFSFYRAYYEMVPRGHFRIAYTVRINNAGEFSLPPTRVEAMYAPDVFGEAPNGKVVVGQ